MTLLGTGIEGIYTALHLIPQHYGTMRGVFSRNFTPITITKLTCLAHTAKQCYTAFCRVVYTSITKRQECNIMMLERENDTVTIRYNTIQ
jgi:hypothetical protein